MSDKIKSPAVDETAGRRLKTNSLAAEYVSAFNPNRFPPCRLYPQPDFTQYFKTRILVYYKTYYGMLFGGNYD